MKLYSLKLFIFSLTIIIIGISFSLYAMIYADHIVKSSLVERTKIIASILDTRSIKTLIGNDNDLNNPEYILIKSKLIDLVKINSDIRFAYLTNITNNDIHFMVDSEQTNSPDYSPPGQVYFEATQLFKDVFKKKESNLEGPLKDRWGSWISALSPIIDPDTNKVIGVVGLDVSARNYYITIALYGIIPILITLIMISFIFFIYRENKKENALIALKSEFASIVAHDLRTPLVGIKWSLESMTDATNTNFTDEQKNTLDLMKNSSIELLKTANEILELSQVTKQNSKSLNLEQCDLISLLNEVNSIFIIPAKEKNINIIFDQSLPKSLTMSCDRLKIKRIFSNLISNAIKYSPDGKNIIIAYSSSKSSYIFSITDQGIGISKDESKNMFREFYRTPEATHSTYGNGLGLFYVKKILNLHGGKIWFESRENIGTTFFIEMPIQIAK